MRYRSSIVVAVACTLMAASPVVADNVIQRENAKPGTDSWQFFSEAKAGEVEGYASATSVNRGEQISFYVSSTEATFELSIYRMGWYGGLGGRLVYGPVTLPGIRQVMPTPDADGMIECNWTNPYTITIPDNPNDATDWASGVYLVKLHAPSANKQKYIPFTVRDDARVSNHYFISSVNTWQAYNTWGGRSLYGDPKTGRPQAQKVSFNRPHVEGAGAGDFLWRWEYNMLRFLEREGYDVTYGTDVDLARRPVQAGAHKDILLVGHPEYWSWDMRTNVENARASGISVGFFSGNSVYWQIRYAPSPISGVADRTIVAYKETAMQQDPYALDKDTTNDKYITTQWRLAPVSRPESALVGVQYAYDPVTNGDIVISDVTSAAWVFTNTGLKVGDKLTGLLGYEVDAKAATSPSNTVVLAHSPFTNVKVTPNRTDYSDMTVYTHTSGATVFSTGSIQWSWGLDDWSINDHGVAPVPAAQQITRNVLARFAGPSAANDCQFVVSPSSVTLTAPSGSSSVSLTVAANCSWNVTTSAPWLTLTSAPSGSGSTTITFSYTRNSGGQRVATLNVADKSVTVTQNGCAFAITPVGASEPAAGGAVNVSVTTDAGCTWTAVSNAPWITVTGGANGTGNGTVSLSVDANNGDPRSGTATIATRLFSVDQASNCTFTLTPSAAQIAAAGGSGTFDVIPSGAQCSWTATSSDTWVTLSPGSGSGRGTVTYTVTTNGGPTRRTSIRVGSATFSLTQSSGCIYRLGAMNAVVASTGGDGVVTVTTDPQCSWTAESHASWLSITSGASGRGNGTVSWAAAANGGPSRIGTLSIAGNGFTVSQGAPGAPTGVNATPLNGNQVQVTWNPVSGASRYDIARSAGSGFFFVIGSTSGTSLLDSGLTPNTAYRYEVRAVDAAGTPSAFSNIDLATTAVFSDDPLPARGPRIRAQHIVELRNAINIVRAAAGLSAFSFTDPDPTRVTIRAVHFDELRAAIDEARDAMSLPSILFTDPALARVTVKTLHVAELRNAVK